MSVKADETYYDILKVDNRATVAEIVAAYHSAKNAFSKDSMATYSLFSPDEVQQVLANLEQAYLTLSNLEKRADYDRLLIRQADDLSVDLPPSMSELERKQNAYHLPKQYERNSGHAANLSRPSQAVASGNPPTSETPEEVVAEVQPPEIDLANLNGTLLKSIREKRGMSIDDVARITKIPAKFVRFIEDNNVKKLPARVYVQGFVKNLASLYRLDVEATVKAYLAFIDRVIAP